MEQTSIPEGVDAVTEFADFADVSHFTSNCLLFISVMGNTEDPTRWEVIAIPNLLHDAFTINTLAQGAHLDDNTDRPPRAHSRTRLWPEYPH